MGAKAPAKVKLRRSKCYECNLNFTSISALWAHKRTIHMNKKSPSKRIALKKQQKKTLINMKTKKTNDLNVEPVKNVIKVNKTFNKKDDQKNIKIATTAETDVGNETSKTQFQCPTCKKLFPVYFPAYRHIQKEHSVNAKGFKVPPNSSEMIKPVKVDVCTSCDTIFKCDQPHICKGMFDVLSDCECAGCTDRLFQNLYMFQIHISQFHSEGVESFFFTEKEEYTRWRNAMETQTKCKYAILNNKTNKDVFCCINLHEINKSRDTPQYCPSSIIVQDYPGGIQVHFYKEHYGHSHNQYSHDDDNDFKKYSITSLLRQVTNIHSDSSKIKYPETDLYLQFEMLMKCITLNAAKINVKGLKILVGKALEMTSVLNGYDEDEESDKAVSSMFKLKRAQKMSENQITEALSNLKSNPKKEGKRRKSIDRKFEDSKKNKIDELGTSSPRIVNCFSLAEVSDTENESEVDKVQLAPIEAELEGFNTGIDSPKPSPMVTVAASPSFHDSYQDFIGKSLAPAQKKTYTPVKKSKVIVKTKIGQFKPSLSPKKREVSPKLDLNNVVTKSKVDFEYEVKEQENDCNILILKI